MQNFDVAVSATSDALNSAGSAQEEFAVAMDSISKKIEGLKGQFQELVTNGGLGDFIKMVLDAGTSILKFANSDIGQAIIKFGLLSGVIALVVNSYTKLTSSTGLLYNAFTKLVPLFVKYNAGMSVSEANLARLSGAQVITASSTISLATGFKALTTAMLTNPIFMGTLAISAFVFAMKESEEAVKRLAQEVEDSVGVQTTAYKDLKNEINSVNKSFNDELLSINTNEQQSRIYVRTLEELGAKTNRTALENLQLQGAIDGLNRLFPQLNLAINKNTGALNMETAQVWKAVEGYVALAKAKAYSNLVTQLEEKKAKASLRLESLNIQRETAEKNLKKRGKLSYWDEVGTSARTPEKTVYDKIEKERAKVFRTILDTGFQQQKYEEKMLSWQVRASGVVGTTNGLADANNNLGVATEGLGNVTAGTGKKIEEAAESEEDALRKLKDSYSDIVEIMEHQLYVSEKKDSADSERIAIMQKIQEELHRQAEYYRSIGLSDNHEYIMALQKQWLDYNVKIKDINEKAIEDEKERKKKALEDEKKARDEALKVKEDAVNKQMDLLNAQLTALEWYAEQEKKIIDDKIDSLNKEKESLEEANSEREKAIQLEQLEEDLARAKSTKVKVFEEGKGFVYRDDISAVSQAQDALDEFKKQQLHQEELDRIDEQIRAWEKEKQEWSDYVSDYKAEQDKLLNEQKLGMTTEKFLQDQKITNLSSFAEQYKSIIRDLVEAQRELNDLSTESEKNDKEWNDSTNGDSGGGGSSGGGKLPEWLGGEPGAPGSNDSNQKQYLDKLSSTGDYGQKEWAKKEIEAGRYANGTTAIPFDQWANVNEDGDELFIPPKGNMEYLQKGTGVIPKTLTENIMEMGKLGLDGIRNFSSNKQSGTSIQTGDWIFPNMTDESGIRDLFRQISNFKNKAIQTAYER